MRILLVSIGLMAFYWAQAQTLPAKFAAIKPGTSETDVVKQVGEPTKIENFATVGNQNFDTSYYWRYQNSITIIFTNHAVSAIEPKWELVLKRIQAGASQSTPNGLKIITRE